MLTAHQLTKSYSLHTILQNITFSISVGERLGLIGPNGCGKTTLLRILAGMEKPDSGTVTHTRPGLRIGYLPQGFDLDPRQTLRTTLSLSAVSMDILESEVMCLAVALAARPNDASLQANYDAALRRLSNPNLQPSTVLVPLGLSDIDPQTPVGSLSGGQKTRLLLARLLLEEPNLLLLDEPTNHLDIQMLELLEGWLRRFPGAILTVSHDRTFLDHTTSRILDLNPEAHTIREYIGNYSIYLEQYTKEHKKQLSAYADQVAEVRRMRQDIARTKQQSL